MAITISQFVGRFLEEQNMPQPVLRGKSRLRGDIGPSHVVHGSLQPRWNLNLVPKLCYLLPLELQAWLPGLGRGAKVGWTPPTCSPAWPLPWHSPLNRAPGNLWECRRRCQCQLPHLLWPSPPPPTPDTEPGPAPGLLCCPELALQVVGTWGLLGAGAVNLELAEHGVFSVSLEGEEPWS